MKTAQSGVKSHSCKEPYGGRLEKESSSVWLLYRVVFRSIRSGFRTSWEWFSLSLSGFGFFPDVNITVFASELFPLLYLPTVEARLVGRLCSNYTRTCALCDTSTKFSVNVHWHMANIFRYWATRNSTFMSAILEFKMAAIWNLHFRL